MAISDAICYFNAYVDASSSAWTPITPTEVGFNNFSVEQPLRQFSQHAKRVAAMP
jgi:hypothetical protein